MVLLLPSDKQLTNENCLLLEYVQFADAWENYTTNHQAEITGAFKKCGMCNDINGNENHLSKLDRLPSYRPPNKDDPPKLVTKKEKKRKSPPSKNSTKKTEEELKNKN